jgi:hypothetical protein
MYFYIKSGSLISVEQGNESFVEQNGIQHGRDIYSKWSEAQLNNIGLYLVTVVKPNLTNTQKYRQFTDDYVAMTRTYNVVDKTQDQLDSDSLNATRKAYQAAMREMEETDKAMPRVVEDLIDLLLLNGTILINDLPRIVQNNYADKKSKRAALPADPDAP